jgi:SAM-dependent methyltransferase
MMHFDEAPARPRPRRRWLALAARVGRLLLLPARHAGELPARRGDPLAGGCDTAWAADMRELTLALLDRLDPPRGAACLDLACGTGFLTSELSQRTGRPAFGVDSSNDVPRGGWRARGRACWFIRSDVLEYLRRAPSRAFDVVTCGWALGSMRSLAMLRQAARVLRPGGRVGIIDTALGSLSEVLWASCCAFAERPEGLGRVRTFRRLPSASALAALMRGAGLGVPWTAGGTRTYYDPTGRAVLERLLAAGASPDVELVARDEHREAILARLAEELERLYASGRGVAVTHRWLAGIAVRT